MNHKETILKTVDGLNLHTQVWVNEKPAEAIIAIIHGLGEHSGRYEPIATFFNNHAISVAGFDLRGHGNSAGLRGHAGYYDFLLEDIQLFLDYLKRENPGIPLFIFGHSLGGNLSLCYLIRKQPDLAGAIITAPLMALPGSTPWFKMFIGKVLYKIYPSFTQKTGLETKHLSRDSEIVRNYQEDPLVHDKVSARLGIDFLHYGKWLQSQTLPEIPILLMQGSDDRIISPEAVRSFSRSQNGRITYKEWPGFFHELHNEPEKETVYQFMIQWVYAQTGKANHNSLT